MAEGLDSFLTPKEIELFKSVIGETRDIKNRGKVPKKVREIVPIRKWVEDEYYVGPPGMSLYPYWKEKLIEVFDETREIPINELIVSGGIGCRPLNTKYHTSVGYKSLVELENVEDVSILGPNNKQVNIKAVHRVGQKFTRKVIFSNGMKMEATIDHRVRVLTSEGIEWRRFDELTKDSCVLLSRNSQGYDGKFYDLDKAYLMGYIYGDGYVTVNNKESSPSVVGVIYNKSLVDLSEIAVKVIGGKEGTTSGGLQVVRATNRELIREWEGIGHSDDKKVPDWFLNTSLDAKRMFLSGLFDSDGSFTKDSVELTLNSSILIEQVQSLLVEFGINASVDWCEGENRNRLYVHGQQNWNRLNDILELRIGYKREILRSLVKSYNRNQRTIMYGLSDYVANMLVLKPQKFTRDQSRFKHWRYRKQNVTLETVRQFVKEFPEYNDYVLNYLVENDCCIINPVKIEESECECGDIEVEGHEYINEGIIQHNTGKSTFGCFCIVRKIYELSCYENIPALFQLMPGTLISFMYFTVSKTQAELTGYGQIKNIIDTIPYFKELFPRNDRLQSMLVFPENLLLFYGSSQCLTGESLVRIDKGLVFARDLRENDKVWNGVDFVRVNKVSETVLPIIQIKTSTGRLLKTSNKHRHYTQRGFVEADRLKVGDYVFSTECEDIEKDYYRFKLDGSLRNDRNKPKKDILVFDENMALCLGWLMGDGCYIEGRSDVRFYANKDEWDVLNKVRDILEGYWRVGEIKEQSESVIGFSLSAKTLIKFLEEIELPYKHNDNKVPKIVLLSNTSVQRAFIRGYFSADGSCKGNNIRVVSNAQPLLYQMQTMLTYMGIYCSVGSNGKPSTKDGYKRQNSWQMMVRGISSDKFMREIGFEGLKSTQYEYKEPVKRGDKLKDSGIEEIVEITNLPEDKVYGALVDGSVYNANGLITHNSHAIGMNMIGSILDEANFFQNGAQNPNKSAIEYSKIAEMYSSIVNRSKSRFKSHKRDDSLSVLISSNTTSSSFTEKRIKEVEGEENALVINARVWDVKPKGTYSDEMFWVFTGSDLLDPYIVKGVEDVYQYTDSMEIPRKEGTVDEIINALLIGREKFVQVPMDFYKQYEDNLIMSLQDISGLSVAPSGRLFSSKPLYRDACNTTLEHPFYKSEIMISTHDEIAIKDYLRKDYRPPRRNKKRFIHVDQSTTNDSTGFASSYIDRYEKDKVSGLWMPIVATDILLRINPPKAPRKISISKVRDFIFYMRDVWDLEIGYVTYDSFASEESLQVLSENGIPCGLLSVDRTDAQYLNLINLIYEHRLETYRYVPAEEELFELIHFRGAHRVDHPQDGSKDVCDGWAGSVWNAITQTKDETPKAEGNSMGHIIAMGRDESPYSLEELLGGIIL